MNNKINDGDGKREQHALDTVAIKESKVTWRERLSQWERPMIFEDRLSWLHTNHVREGNGPERFIFFLELADRYGERDVFTQLPNHDKHLITSKSYLSIAQLKSQLSKKAFAILCNVFFNKEEPPCPIYVPYQNQLFSKLLWFFRPYGGDGGWDNLRPYTTDGLAKDDGRHYVDIANKFAKEFVLDAWQMLNHHWFKCWDTDEPDPKVAEPHWREIVVLLRHLDMLKIIEDGQYIPIPSVFKKMVGMVLEEHHVTFNKEDLEDIQLVGKLLEPLAKKGDRLARSLNITRLNVNDHDHSTFRI
jgi:hypothetical protein